MSATFTPPTRTHDQRMTALENANNIRLARATLKRDIKAKRTSASSVLATPPDWVDTMKLMDLLMALPRVGSVASMRAFRLIEIGPMKTVGGISPRQRRELLRWLHGR